LQTNQLALALPLSFGTEEVHIELSKSCRQVRKSPSGVPQ
jgi:hypothetical protein